MPLVDIRISVTYGPRKMRIDIQGLPEHLLRGVVSLKSILIKYPQQLKRHIMSDYLRRRPADEVIMLHDLKIVSNVAKPRLIKDLFRPRAVTCIVDVLYRLSRILISAVIQIRKVLS